MNPGTRVPILGSTGSQLGLSFCPRPVHRRLGARSSNHREDGSIISPWCCVPKRANKEDASVMLGHSAKVLYF